MVVILYYDSILTLPLEVDRFWLGRRPLSRASVVFFMIRYFAIIFSIPVLYQTFGIMPELVSELSNFSSADFGMLIYRCDPEIEVGLTSTHDMARRTTEFQMWGTTNLSRNCYRIGTSPSWRCALRSPI